MTKGRCARKLATPHKLLTSWARVSIVCPESSRPNTLDDDVGYCGANGHRGYRCDGMDLLPSNGYCCVDVGLVYHPSRLRKSTTRGWFPALVGSLSHLAVGGRADRCVAELEYPAGVGDRFGQFQCDGNSPVTEHALASAEQDWVLPQIQSVHGPSRSSDCTRSRLPMT